MHESVLIPGPDGPSNDNYNKDSREDRGSDSMKTNFMPRAITEMFRAE